MDGKGCGRRHEQSRKIGMEIEIGFWLEGGRGALRSRIRMEQIEGNGRNFGTGCDRARDTHGGDGTGEGDV